MIAVTVTTMVTTWNLVAVVAVRGRGRLGSVALPSHGWAVGPGLLSGDEK